MELELNPDQFVTRSFGRRNWFREGRREVERQREEQARPIARPRAERLAESRRRRDEELALEHAANRTGRVG